MAVSAAQKEIPLVKTGQTAILFGVASDPITTDISKPVAPDRKRETAGIRAELEEKFAHVLNEKHRAVLHAAASGVEAANSSDIGELTLNGIIAIAQSKSAPLWAAGAAYEVGSFISEIYQDRYAAKQRSEARPEDNHAEAQVESLRESWRVKDELGVGKLNAANDAEFDIETALEEQARKQIMTPSDPNTQALFGAKMRIDRDQASVRVREEMLPPGAVSVHDPKLDPDLAYEYHERHDQKLAFRIPGLG
jgi:hypothetical protein